MPETPDLPEWEAPDEEIRSLGRKCALCNEDIATEGDLESYNHSNKLCRRCARQGT
jgi:hypothetical protein